MLGRRYLVLLIVIFLFSGCEKKDMSVPALEEPVSSEAETVSVSRGNIFDLATYDGRVYPDIQEVSFQADGTLGEIKVSLGQEVKKGDILMSLDASRQEEELKQLEAELSDDRHNDELENQKADLDIQIALLTIQQKAAEKAPDIDIEGMKAELKKKRLIEEQTIKLQNYNIDKLIRKIDTLKKELETTAIAAPCSGNVVYLKSLHRKDRVNACDTVAIVTDNSQLHIQSGYIDENELKAASQVYASIRGKEYKIEYVPLSKEEILRLKDSGKQLVNKYSFPPAADVSAGDYACIFIKENLKENVINIPKAALYGDSKGYFVYRQKAGSPERCNVEIGIMTSTQVEITRGLAEGDTVYLQGSTPSDSKGKDRALIEVTSSDYEELSALKDVTWTYLKSDKLAIEEPQGIFGEYLVSDRQEVKKGDPLITYQIPVDSLAVEEKAMSFRHEKDNSKTEIKRRKTELKEAEKRLSGMDDRSIEAQILELDIQRGKIEYEQYQNQSAEQLEKMRLEIQGLEEDMQTQYIYAPYDGVVSVGEARKTGDSINPYIGLITIYDTKSAVLAAPQAAAGKLWYGMQVSATGISNMQEDTANPQTGTVIAEDSLLYGEAATGMIYIQLEENNLVSSVKKVNIRAVSAQVPGVPVIPLNLVKAEKEMRYVLVLDEDDGIRKQFITGRDNGIQMWVYNGLSCGQKIVTE